jgi:hypothetical protein
MNALLSVCVLRQYARRLQSSTVKAAQQRLCSRLLQRGFERLELDEAKVSRPVLGGGSGSNATSLPDNA